jgi:hypothetical protein
MARFLVPNLYDDLITSDAFLAYCADSVAYFMKAMQYDDQTSPRMDFFSSSLRNRPTDEYKPNRLADDASVAPHPQGRN